MAFLNKYALVNGGQAVKDVAGVVTQIVTKASREHYETEYELLKKENAALRDRCMQAECILREMHIDPKVVERIIPDTVHRWESKSLRDFSTHIIIEFDVSDYDIRDI